MNPIETTVQDLFNGQSTHPPRDNDAIVLEARKVYHFLPAPVTVEVEGECVRLSCPEPSPADQARAECLAEEAAGHAREGRCEQAIGLWLQVVALHPRKVESWRDLGMASGELQHYQTAREYLHTALRLDPHDTGSLVALARLALVAEEEDVVTAGVFARRAWAAGPDDPWALNCMGVVLACSGQEEEAVPFFAATIEARPEYAPPYLSLACVHLHQGRFEAARSCLQALFSKASPQDVRCHPVFTRAVQLMQAIEAQLVSQN